MCSLSNPSNCSAETLHTWWRRRVWEEGGTAWFESGARFHSMHGHCSDVPVRYHSASFHSPTETQSPSTELRALNAETVEEQTKRGTTVDALCGVAGKGDW